MCWFKPQTCNKLVVREHWYAISHHVIPDKIRSYYISWIPYEFKRGSEYSKTIWIHMVSDDDDQNPYEFKPLFIFSEYCEKSSFPGRTPHVCISLVPRPLGQPGFWRISRTSARFSRVSPMNSGPTWTSPPSIIQHQPASSVTTGHHRRGEAGHKPYLCRTYNLLYSQKRGFLFFSESSSSSSSL